jgi:phosphatidate phosphatase PAH1
VTKIMAGRFVAALFLGLAACSGSGGNVSGEQPGDARPTFRWCEGRGFVPAPEQDFRHTTNEVLLSALEPSHSAEDAIVRPEQPASLVARFSYGALATDLADEDVRVFLDDCGGYRSLGDHTTDDDGRIVVTAPTGLGPGVYEVRFQVLGDQSTTVSYLWVLPETTHLVVTDIDGTLTASDSELFEQVLDGTEVPDAYPGAVALTQRHAALSSVVVYLTGRPYWLTQRTRDWTAELGFALGPLRVAGTEAEALPGESGVGDYKLTWLEGLLAQGYTVDFAYGNASTDIYAYLGAGFDPSLVWIIGDHAGERGTNAATDTWEPRVAEVEALPPVEQPFRFPAR